MKLQLTILLSLLLVGSAVNWQAEDNITQSNRTLIWTTIDNNFASYAPSNLAPFSTFISNALNDAWNPAWNVFVIQLIDPTLDAVMYGYAFRSHWMWFNGYSYGGKFYSFVIWKDYNCHTWNTISNSDLLTNFPSTHPSYPMYLLVGDALGTISTRLTYENIWKTHSILVEKCNQRNPGNAFSMIAVQNGLDYTSDSSTNMNGHFCSAGGGESYLFTILYGLDTLSGGTNGVHKALYIKTR